MFTDEEFDRRVAEARKRGRGNVTGTDCAFHEALSMAYEANRYATAVLSWSHPARRLSAKARMGQLRDIATGRAGEEERERYEGAECGRCAHGRPAVWCGLTGRMYLPGCHGDPHDARCEP